MNRRSFLKRVGALLSLAYVNPIGLIPESKNTLASPFEVAVESKPYFLGSFSKKFIEPAMQKLANKIDEDILNQLMKEYA